MTVARLEAEMSNAEFNRWHVFLSRRAQREELARKQAEGRARR